MKYDNMVRRNRRVNEEKKERAIFAIKKLLLENEPVTVSTLAEKTGLSREFFYKNEKVRNCLARAREQQRDQIFQRPQKALFDRAMEAQLEETKRQLIRERKDKEKLEEEVSRLQKALKKKDINLLRKL
jgi:macrodomain Ter protein organizer (MatP/YcbG family)